MSACWVMDGFLWALLQNVVSLANLDFIFIGRFVNQCGQRSPWWIYYFDLSCKNNIVSDGNNHVKISSGSVVNESPHDERCPENGLSFVFETFNLFTNTVYRYLKVLHFYFFFFLIFFILFISPYQINTTQMFLF